MRNHWLTERTKRCTRETIRQALGHCPDLGDEQIEFAIVQAGEFFYKHRHDPWQLAMEGAVLASDVILKMIRRLFARNDDYKNAVDAYNDWKRRVEFGP